MTRSRIGKLQPQWDGPAVKAIEERRQRAIINTMNGQVFHLRVNHGDELINKGKSSRVKPMKVYNEIMMERWRNDTLIQIILPSEKDSG